ncbi:MAG: MBL fold metallo-hydrolase [Kiritimatiellae bacterium]|nr:MBL fold metallo-hydrolase [Kiritimatiellia bacterium]
MKAIFLGTGTSAGIPIIGCHCPVCASADPHNRRRRTSLYLEAGGKYVLVDTPPDFREQAIEHRLPRIDAVCFTHSHADHIFGFDDIRRFNTIQDEIIPAYADAGTLADLQRIFNYIGTEHVVGFYRPRITFNTIDAPFNIGDVLVTPVEVEHGHNTILGFRFDADGRSLGYVPDCSAMSEAAIDAFRGIDIMILDALRLRPHLTHLTLEDSVALLKQIGAGKSYIIHLCHDLDHEETQAKLPESCFVSYDGLTLEW